MIFAVNVDPRFADGAPTPDEVRAYGFDGVALVSREDTHEYAWHMRESGIHVLARIDKSSNGHMVPADMYQIGNEPDIKSESSWTMTPGEWLKLWDQYRDTYPDLKMIGPGLASGDPTWWTKANKTLHGCDGVAVHPYAKNASDALLLLRAYANIVPKRKVWVSEWNRPVSELQVFLGMLGGMCEYAAWFCWSDAMVDGFGLVNGDGAKLEGVRMGEALKAWGA